MYFPSTGYTLHNGAHHCSICSALIYAFVFELRYISTSRPYKTPSSIAAGQRGYEMHDNFIVSFRYEVTSVGC